MINGNPSQLPRNHARGGYDENGYYGTGFTTYARPATSSNSSDA